jgi:hypothetical protein
MYDAEHEVRFRFVGMNAKQLCDQGLGILLQNDFTARRGVWMRR